MHIEPHTTKDIKEHHGIRGVVTITNFSMPDTMEARLLDQFLRNVKCLHPAKYREALSHLQGISTVRQESFTNQVHQSGRAVFARLLLDDTTYSGEINYGALGSSTAAITDSDTTLTTEVARKPVASRSRTNDSATIDFYFSKNDTNGTYEEFGTFIDGTASADTGQMFNRLLTGGWTKSTSEAMTVSLQVNINSA